MRDLGARFADVLAGVATATLAFAAVPAALVLLVGVPLPHHWVLRSVLSWRGAFDALAITAWAAWAACAWPLLRAVVHHVRRRDVNLSSGARLGERLAVRMAAAVLAFTPVGTVAGVAAATPTVQAASSVPAAMISLPRTATTVGTMGVATPGGPTAGPTTAASAPGPGPGPGAPGPGPGASGPGASGAESGASGAGAGSPLAAPVPAAALVTPVTAASATAQSTTYTVVVGDSLWSIAQRAYGAGVDWPAIAATNLGRLMTDGTRFLDPAVIQPGWVLDLPALDGVAPAPTASATATPAPPTTSSPVEAAAQRRGLATSPGGTAGTPATQTATAGGVTTAAGATGAGTLPPTHGRRNRPSADPKTSTSPLALATVPPLPLPTLGALGFGVVTAALVARRARQNRRLRALRRREGDPPEPPDDATAELAAGVAPFDSVPLLDWVEVANRWLSIARTPTSASGVQAIRAGADGVEVRLAPLSAPATRAAAGPPAPPGPPGPPSGWTSRSANGYTSWLLPATAEPSALAISAGDEVPLVPLLVPLGEDDTGSWFLPVHAGSSLVVVGPAAEAFVAAAALGAASWSWREGVTVTSEPARAEQAASLPTTAVLFVGDPAAIGDRTRERTGVLTTTMAPGAHAVVVVDAAAATVHPVGLTVRPNLLDARRVPAVASLLGDASSRPGQAVRAATGHHRDPDAPCDPPLDPGPQQRPTPTVAGEALGAIPVEPLGAALPGQPPARRRPRSSPLIVDRSDAVVRVNGTASLAAGRAEVRLLVAVPRIDGLQAPLAPNRARRAVEVVAYLALHPSGAVTSDRLRTRVLGSEDADAAAKTLFNTVGAARRSLGLDDSGMPLLPPAGRNGRYRLSEAVTADAARAAALVDTALAVEDQAACMADLESALGLIEGEPLSGILAGYAWWQAEGHARRTADLLVDGGCRLAVLAAAEGHLDLARWAIEQARRVEPYSEALSRTAMEVAAAAGDAARLHAEWLACLRMVDEVDPGGFPSPQTERLYGELRQRLAVPTAGR